LGAAAHPALVHGPGPLRWHRASILPFQVNNKESGKTREIQSKGFDP
jgi:hypothetical protein